MMIKIEEVKIRPYGLRGYQITVPKVWVTDNELKTYDKVNVYRDKKDHLTLIISKKENNAKLK